MQEEVKQDASPAPEPEKVIKPYDPSKLTFTLDLKKITDSVNNKLKDEDYMASMGLNKKQEPAPTPEPVAEEV